MSAVMMRMLDEYQPGLGTHVHEVAALSEACADAFAAMTHRRPHAEARSIESMRRELRACSGTQFDPAAAVAFLAVLDQRSTPAEVGGPSALALS